MENLCEICPRDCRVNRSKNLGYCRSSEKVKISMVMLHHFEEPIISGENETDNGSGTIFFSNCSLKCCYCQNSEISADGLGKEITIQKLAEIFKELEKKGAYNINLVTPTHFTSQIIEALKIYKPNIPIVWNTSGYEKPETIKKLAGFVDVFLTDFKYFSPEIAEKYSRAKNYPEMCKASILEMRKIVPDDKIENGLMKSGLIVRHLVLPNQTNDSLNVIDWINNNLGNKTYFSLMAQYVPMAKAKDYPEINRKIKPIEYKVLIKKLNELNFTNAYLQDYDSANTTYTPNFASGKSIVKF